MNISESALRCSIDIAPPNSLINIVTAEDPDIPILEHGLAVGTANCISVGTLMFLDGTTEVSVGANAPSGLLIAGEWTLEVTGGFVAVETTHEQMYLRHSLENGPQSFRVWVSDDRSEPDAIYIEIVGHKGRLRCSHDDR